ncbi:hypothetical protein ACF3NX_06345 [Acetobacter orientalis]|uniref:hypothetical protein n=1 Tax=Acetobacter orientalis TaxID=146474 RepID=UPI00386969C3
MPDDQAASTLRIVILSYIAQAISNLEFSSSSQAQDILKEIKPIFEAQFNDQNMDVTAYNRMRRLYTKAVADIGQRGSILPRVVTFAIDPEDSIPLPVLAQYIYQDGSMADDILLRNNQTIIHPLFVNTSLEVINNG